MRKKSLLILTVLVLCLSFSIDDIESATYYLDAVNGDDTNAGTEAQPWKTLARAQNYNLGYWPAGYDPKVQPGDTVLFKDGNYGVFLESSNVDPVEKWHVHRTNWITYKAASGHNPILTRIVVNNGDHYSSPLYQPGESYLIFDGFRVLEGAEFWNTEYIQLVDCNITSASLNYAGEYAPYYADNTQCVRFTKANHVTVKDCEISYCWRGIEIDGQYYTIDDNLIHRFVEDGIGGAASDCVISDNNIYDSSIYRGAIYIVGTKNGTFQLNETVIQNGTNAKGIVYNTGGADRISVMTTSSAHFVDQLHGGGTITGQTSGATLLNITFWDGAHSDGIQFQGGGTVSNVTITRNIIHGGMWNCLKLASYTNGLVQNVTVSNNLGYDTYDYALFMASEIKGVGPDAVFQNVNFYNNTFWGTTRTFALRNAAKIENLYNNIIYELWVEVGRAIGVTNHGNNIFHDNPNNALFTMNGTETINATPGFADAANGDFRLAQGSAAVDFGDPAYAPATDLEGNLRDALPDAGCYEYGSTHLKGDVNKDGKVNIQDVQCCVNHILGKQDWGSEADVNGDGAVDKADVQGIIKIILEK